MSVSPEDVARIADLAHLGLEAEERERLADDLNRILGHVDALRRIEAVGVSELTPQLDPSLIPTRQQGAEVADPLAASPEGFAPEMADGFFVVPPPPGLDQDSSE